MSALASYSTGTVSVAANGTTVTGTGTIWSGVNARPGDTLQIGGVGVLITDVTDETHLVIPPWPGSTLSGATYAYKVSQQRVAGAQAMADVSTAVGAWNSLGYFVFVDPALSAPDASLGNDGQYALQPNTRKYWLKTGGVWVFQGQPGVGDAVLASQNHFTDTTASTSPSTGAMVIDGGVGIGADLHVAGVVSAGIVATTAWQFDASGVALITLTTGQATAFPPGGGLIYVKNESTGECALFMVTGGQVVMFAQIGSTFAAGSSSGGKTAVVWTGTAYALANGTASTANYRVMMLRGNPNN